MSTFVISDIHGEYEQLKELLTKMNFGAQDKLYVLGDVVDRGPEPIRALQFLMRLPNCICLVGNHEFMAYMGMKILLKEVTEESVRDFAEKDQEKLKEWMINGGIMTIADFTGLSGEERKKVITYLGNLEAYVELEVNGQEHLLVHAGLGHFSEEKPMEEYTLDDLIRAIFTKQIIILQWIVELVLKREDWQASAWKPEKNIMQRRNRIMKNKIIGWNINQRSGMGGRIPDWVAEELLEQRADIIVLTELYKVGDIKKFWNKMKDSGYGYAITDNGPGMNEVGILWRKELYTLIAVDDSIVSETTNNAPNLLIVDLEDRHHNRITVVGFRIRIVEHRERAKELQTVIDKVGQYRNPVIMAADGNNLRRGTEEIVWNLKVMDEMLGASGFQRNTPEGSSIFTEQSEYGKEYEFAEDHIIGRNVKITMEPYDRDFVRRAPLSICMEKIFNG